MSHTTLIAFAEAEGAISSARYAALSIWKASPIIFMGVYGCELEEYSSRLDKLRAYIHDQRKTLEDARKGAAA
jgi:hypothetical protein